LVVVAVSAPLESTIALPRSASVTGGTPAAAKEFDEPLIEKEI